METTITMILLGVISYGVNSMMKRRTDAILSISNRFNDMAIIDGCIKVAGKRGRQNGWY